LGLESGSVGDGVHGFTAEKSTVGQGFVLEELAHDLFSRFALHRLQLVLDLSDGAPTTSLVGSLVELIVGLIELWRVFVMVLWSSNFPKVVKSWGNFLSIVSSLDGFLVHELDSFAQLGGHVELHEVLGEGAVAGGVAGSAIIRVGEAGGGFVVVVRVGFGGSDVGAWAFGGVSSPLSAVVGTITERSAVSLHETIVGEVQKGVNGVGVLGMVNSSDLVFVGRVVAEVDVEVLESVESVFL